jgi:ribosomal protein S18 acetylase RimI-like enzyme
MFTIASSALLFSSLVIAMENTQKDYSFSLATKNDSAAIVDLINTQATKDADKIVILPESFRLSAIANASNKERLFVARDITQGEKIVAFKKLFLLTDNQERNEIMQDEIRCIGSKSESTFAGMIKKGAVTTLNTHPTFGQDDLYIYNGGDFTHPDYRKNGLNKELSQHAFSTIFSDQLSKQSPARIHLLFGLVQANSGSNVGEKGDRAIPLADVFSNFIRQVYPNTKDDISLTYHRYKAFMPTFDPTSSECKPLPDEKAIPGYGCILTYENNADASQSGKVQE